MFGRTKEKKSDLEKVVFTIDGGKEIMEKLKGYSSKEIGAMIKFFSDQTNLFVDKYAKNRHYRFILNFIKDYTPAKQNGNPFSMTVTIRNVDSLQNINTTDPTISFSIIKNEGDKITIGSSDSSNGGCKIADAMEFIILLKWMKLNAEEREEEERKKIKHVH